MKKTEKEISIKAPNFATAEFLVIGNAPYVQNAFPKKAMEQMKGKQEAGSQARTKKIREAKNFEECYEEAQHISKEGWNGIHAGGIRTSFISACRLVGFKMTLAKLGIFVVADGFDKNEGTPLVRIVKGKPHISILPVRLETGVTDLRARAMWNEGWEASVKIKYDADMFSLQDITNLFMRVGQQVGWGEGRPDSKRSCGMGWGTFDLSNRKN